MTITKTFFIIGQKDRLTQYIQSFYFLGLLVHMISVEKARSILSKNADSMTDGQVQDLLNFLYHLCDEIYDEIVVHNKED
jgi:hypothetical protein